MTWRWVRRILPVGAVVGAAIIGVRYWLSARHYEWTDDAFIDAHIERVAPQVGGRVSRVLVDDNQRVDAGGLLVEIDAAEFRAKLDQAIAAAGEAEGRLAVARAQKMVADTDVQQRRAEAAAAMANATQAASDLARARRLRTERVVAQEDLDHAVASADRTAAELLAARRRTAAGEAQVALATAQIEVADADVRHAHALVDQAKLQVSYTHIHSAQAGYVTRKAVEPGDYVQIGQDLMAIVSPYVWVIANFKETRLSDMRPHQPVDIAIDAYPGRTFDGHVDSIQFGTGARFSLLPPENATGNYVKVVQRVPVKILFDHPPDADLVLGPGMSVVPHVKVR
jgi:membrane fusion protein (multidrug efflux system)